jgi:electron transport complex protein RnfA
MKKDVTAIWTLFLLIVTVLIGGCKASNFIKTARFEKTNQILLTFAGPVNQAWAANPDHFTVNEKPDPDILLAVQSVRLNQDQTQLTITLADPINQDQPHQVIVKKSF